MEKDILVNIGRVVYINFGPLSGKLAVIVDLVNASKIIVDGPSLGIVRTVISNKRISVTPFSIPQVTSKTTSQELDQLIKSFGVQERFAKTAIGQKIRKQNRRATLTDFERFKVYVYKKQLGRAVRTKVNIHKSELKQAAKKIKK